MDDKEPHWRTFRAGSGGELMGDKEPHPLAPYPEISQKLNAAIEKLEEPISAMVELMLESCNREFLNIKAVKHTCAEATLLIQTKFADVLSANDAQKRILLSNRNDAIDARPNDEQAKAAARADYAIAFAPIKEKVERSRDRFEKADAHIRKIIELTEKSEDSLFVASTTLLEMLNLNEDSEELPTATATYEEIAARTEQYPSPRQAFARRHIGHIETQVKNTTDPNELAHLHLRLKEAQNRLVSITTERAGHAINTHGRK